MMPTKLKTMLMAMMGIFIAGQSMGQSWSIGNQVMTFVDASRGNRQIETQVFYPADVAGINVPLGSPVDQKYPVIVFGHDLETDYVDYFYIWNKFTTYGFVVAIPLTEMGPNPDVLEFAKDMAFVASQFNTMRYTPGSFFHKRYNGKSCVMGHGIGGSAATLAVQYYPVTTMVSLAATETTPSAINAASLVTVPSVVVAGEDDCVAPVATNQLPMFNNIDSDCKTFINMENGTHCHFAMNGGYCLTMQGLCNGVPSSFNKTTRHTTYLLISFLRYYLKSNAPALAKFEWKLQQKKNDWTYIMACSQLAPRVGDDMNDIAEDEMTVAFYPNPVSSDGVLNVNVNTEIATEASVIVSNLMGQVVSQQHFPLDAFETEFRLPVHQLNKGYYMVTVISEEGKISKPLLVQ